MKKCGFIFLLFLGISTYYASNVDAASSSVACDIRKEALVQCASDSAANIDYCDTSTFYCLGKANEAISMGCTDAEIVTATSAIKQKCQDHVACETFETELDNCVSSTVNADYCSTGQDYSSCLDKANEAPSKTCTYFHFTDAADRIRNNCQGNYESVQECYNYTHELYKKCGYPSEADAAYCDNSTEGSCINKLEFVLNVCNGTVEPDEVMFVTDNCVRLEESCDEFSTDLNGYCATQEAGAANCDEDNEDSCLFKLEFVQKRCKEKLSPEVMKFGDKCDYLNKACYFYLSDLKGECTQQEEADKNYCEKNTLSSCSNMLEYVQNKCKKKLDIYQVKNMTDKCDYLDSKCGVYLSDLKGDCAHQKADAAYCDESVAGSCSNKLEFVQSKCFDTLTPDEEKKITDKCDNRLT